MNGRSVLLHQMFMETSQSMYIKKRSPQWIKNVYADASLSDIGIWPKEGGSTGVVPDFLRSCHENVQFHKYA